MIPLLLALSCLPVDGPKLLARHFVDAAPGFSTVAGDTEVGAAPVPGAVRTFRPDEVLRIAAKFNVVMTGAQAICFEWPMAPLDRARVAEAMRSGLPQDASLEVLEVSRINIPPGQIEFPLPLLKAGFWRGYVRYATNSRYDIWARVRVTVKQTRLVASVAVKANEMITSEQLSVETLETPPERDLVADIRDAIGMQSKRPIAAGTVITKSMLEPPAVVRKGDTVRLRAVAGAAQVIVEVHAESSGRPGELIPVKNPTTGRVLRARVERAGEVTVGQ